MLGKAIRIASTAFEKKKDKGGQPYILHCMYVMHKVKHLGETAMICAILHDLVEDCEDEGYDYQYLRKKGFPENIISILKLLYHDKAVPYMDYIKVLSNSLIAKEVKMADLEHNSKITRLKGLTKKDIDRLEMYMRAYEYLKE